MGDFQVHHIQFFDFAPQAIQSMAYHKISQKLAVSRCMLPDNAGEISLSSIEIWNTQDHWFQEQVFPPTVPVHALLWCQDRLFSAGMDEQLHEHDLVTEQPKYSVMSNSGVIWCLTANQSQTIIAAGTERGCIVLFEVTEDGVLYSKVFSNQGDRILSIFWHNAMNLIVTGGIDNIRVWNVQSGQAIRRICVERATQKVETLVASLAVVGEFTIVSGDSRGSTCFWDGHTGTQLQSFRPHSGPIFALCTSTDGSSVFTSGVDPAVIQFEYISDVTGDKWVRTAAKSTHSHDVRCLICTGSHVVSAGVDGKLISYPTNKDKSLASFVSISSMPQWRPLVHSALEAKSILLQYPTRVELWSLGSTLQSSDEDGALLDLETTPRCCVSLSARNGCFVHCSAVASDARWIAYSDQRSVRLFHIISSDGEFKVSKMRGLPGVSCANCLIFSHDGGRLFVATSGGQITVVKLDTARQPAVDKVINVSRDCEKTVHCNSLAVSESGDYLAVSNVNQGVYIYRLKKYKYLCSVPVNRPTSMSFHRTQPLLLVTSADRTLIEYDIEHREYSAWSREFNAQVPTAWKIRQNALRQAFYNAADDKIFICDDELFCLVDKTQKLPEKTVRLFQNERSKRQTQKYDAIYVCQRFKYLLFLAVLPDGSLVIVERTPSAMLESLPPSLRRKKFGM